MTYQRDYPGVRTLFLFGVDEGDRAEDAYQVRQEAIKFCDIVQVGIEDLQRTMPNSTSTKTD